MTDLIHRQHQITTTDGRCPALTWHPRAAGPWPAVLMYMDGIGFRPALSDVAARLAGMGYYVLLPDLYYRSGHYAPMDARTLFTDPDSRERLKTVFMAHTTVANIMRDTTALLDFLTGDPAVRPGPIAATGYCMGGKLALSAAATFPDRFAAVASYHGGRLANDDADSPHKMVSQITAEVYVAGAIDDASFPDDMKQRLEQALTAAGVRHRIETYPAHHGWVFADTLSYDPGAADRHFTTLADLLRRTLG